MHACAVRAEELAGVGPGTRCSLVRTATIANNDIPSYSLRALCIGHDDVMSYGIFGFLVYTCLLWHVSY